MFLFLFCLTNSLEIDSGSLGGYFTSQQTLDFITQIESQYPKLATLNIIGQSTNGIQIPYLKLHSQDGLDQQATRPLIISAGLYAGFPLSTTSVLYAIQKIVDFQDLLQDRTVYFIPIINIDAYNQMADSYSASEGFTENYKNKRSSTCTEGSENSGVNLNRNFGYQWGREYGSSEDGCQPTYKGTSAFSQYESYAIYNLVANLNSGMWMHFQRKTGYFLHPYSYISSSDESIKSMNDAQREFYEGLFEDYAEGVFYGSAQELLGVPQSGTLIDYVFSKDFLSLELGVKEQATIQQSLENLDDIINHFFLSSMYEIEFSQGDIQERECGDGYECSQFGYSVIVFSYFFDNDAPVSTPDFTIEFQFTQRQYSDYSYEVVQVYSVPYQDQDDFEFDQTELENYKISHIQFSIGNGGTGTNATFIAGPYEVTAVVVIVERRSIENPNATVTPFSEFIAYPTAMTSCPVNYDYSSDQKIELSSNVGGGDDGDDQEEETRRIGFIVGGSVFGISICCCLPGFIVCCCIYKRKKKNQYEAPPFQNSGRSNEKEKV